MLIDQSYFAAVLRLARYRLTRRDLRLGSGLVLFAYITAHLLNHALGLVSIDLAERGLRIAVTIWHSALGTTILYTAAGTHLALAMVAIYERRTLRMPAIEALRIALGFAMPLLLIGHFATTRVAFELYGLDPDYHRVVQALWRSNSEGRQLALLAPGWLHGCFGFNFAFGQRSLYRRMRPALVGVALLLPALAALGFLAMLHEIGALQANQAAVALAVPASERIALAHIRDVLLTAYIGTIGLVVAARLLRALIERYRLPPITIDYPGRRVRAPRGWTVLEVSRSFRIPHRAECAGRARCSTCRVLVIAGSEHCPTPVDDEAKTLARIHAPANVRLACQLRPAGDIKIVPLLRPRPRKSADYSMA